MAKTVKIGFIGTGGIGRYQMEKLSKVADVQILAAADVSKDNLEKAKAQYKIEHVFTDWRKLVEMPELDAVSVCTPNGMHCEPTVAALKAGKHVLVEKPLAMNAKEGTQMVKAATASGKLLQIGFQWRFSPGAQFIRKHVAAGDLGDIVYVRCQALRRRGILSNCVLTCFNAAVLAHIKRQDSAIKVQGFPARMMSNFAPEPHGTYSQMDYVGIHIGDATAELGESFRRMGIVPGVWVVDDPAVAAKAVAMGMAIITSNAPDQILPVVRAVPTADARG